MSKTDKMLQNIGWFSSESAPWAQVLPFIGTEDGVATAQGPNATSVIQGVTAVLDVTGGMQAITEGVNAFLEGSTVLMNALDEVSKLHPFIGGVFE